MRLRALVRCALVLMVLTMSTGAPACDLFCSFEQLHFAGHEPCLAHGANSSAEGAPRTVSSASTMDDMAMDHMAMPGVTQQIASPEDSPVATMLTTTGCAHEPRSQAAVSVSAKSTVDRSPLAVACTLASSATGFAASFSRIRIKQFDATPPKLGPLDPLGTTLRV
jgi:hypothetical protein